MLIINGLMQVHYKDNKFRRMLQTMMYHARHMLIISNQSKKFQKDKLSYSLICSKMPTNQAQATQVPELTILGKLSKIKLKKAAMKINRA